MGTFLTLDVGTTAVKAALFDAELNMLGLVIREYSLLTPRQDEVELPAFVYWDNIVAGVNELLKKTNADAKNVLSITCTTQGETFIPVDKDGNALYNAIVWLDARAKEETAILETQYSKEAFYQKTGIPEISPYCPIAKLMWVKSHLPEVYAATHKFLLLEDYLIYRLTGSMLTNPALMCTTGYFDINTDELWHEILEQNGLDASKIPDVRACGTSVGPLLECSAKELGLTASTIVTTGAMDQVAAAIGAGNIGPGFITETTGTCLAVGASTRTPRLESWTPVPVYTHGLPGLYLKIVIMQTAGMALKWFRNEFCLDLLNEGGNTYDRMGELAASVPPLSRGLYLFPHFTGLYADPDARGVFFGIGLDTGRDCFIRATMESIGYMLRESVELLGEECVAIHSSGGGAKSEIWSSIKADICDAPVHVMAQEEAALLGAAILGGLATGQFESLEEGAKHIALGKTFTPGEFAPLYKEGYKKYLRLYEQFAPLFH
ncbi:hypothetical protein LJC42_00915 [Eubacteriales bacterium OttesenSCG-928-K08]|nr:hypothetical protein [Eubacteriales bacterium OttesenSCG-928-K08]